jgi:hypothetical protein
VKRETREKARQLRQDGCSVRDISQMLNVSKGTVSVWVRDIELKPEQIAALKEKQRRYVGQNLGAQENRRKHQALRAGYQEEGRTTAREMRPLHFAGCMLYWAEGAKRRNSLYLVNSDPRMLQFFMRFLREELFVNDDMVTLYIQCHVSDSLVIREIESYWLELLSLPASSIRKTHVKKGSEYRKNTLEHGVCGICVNSTRLLQHIYGAIQEYGGFDQPAWLF